MAATPPPNSWTEADRTDDFVAKVRLLEESVGHKASHQLLDPFALDPGDAVQVQEAGRRIAEFTGLGSYRFVINFRAQDEHTAGRIELRDDVSMKGGHIDLRASFGKECLIELSETIRSSSAAVVATLAHEITHKYLHVNHVSSGLGPTQDEVLTDIALVWLGLGKLALNGCESRSVQSNWSRTRTTTTHQRVGYLTRTQFAFIYLLVSTMRGLSETAYEHALSVDALAALHEVRQRYSGYFSHHWRTDEVPALFSSRLRQAIDQAQVVCAGVARDVALVRASCLGSTELFLTTSHAIFRSHLEESERLSKDEEVNPSLRFLKNVELDKMTARWEGEIDAIVKRGNDYRAPLAEILAIAQRARQLFTTSAADVLETIQCPQDRTLLRVPPGKEQVRVRCPVCRYDWIVRTVAPDEAGHSQARGESKGRPAPSTRGNPTSPFAHRSDRWPGPGTVVARVLVLIAIGTFLVWIGSGAPSLDYLVYRGSTDAPGLSPTGGTSSITVPLASLEGTSPSNDVSRGSRRSAPTPPETLRLRRVRGSRRPRSANSLTAATLTEPSPSC